MSRFHPLIASRVFNTPLLIHAGKLDAIAGALMRQWGVQIQAPEPEAYTTARGEAREPGYRIVDGVAVIDIFGVLAHRGGVQADSSYILGYQTIARRLEAAVNDNQADRILLDLDTPGGEVSGVFELAEQIRAANARKPVYAVADSLAASAGYLIGSAASEFSVTRTGYTGSVGVVWRHVDFSQALQAEGIGITHVYAGARKVAGNPFEPLPEDVRAEFQADVDRLYEMFVTAVSEYRGLDAKRIMDTEARVYLGEEGVKQGLVDRIETADEMLARISRTTPGAGSRQLKSTQGGNTMSTEHDDKHGGEPAPIAAADHEKAVTAAKAEAYDNGLKAGATAERERISGIMNAEEAAGRETLAAHLAFETNTSAEDAVGLLAKSPKAEAGAPSRLDAAMAGTQQPGIGPDSAEAEAGEAEQRNSLVAAIAAGGNR